jgi:hypothetical protein
MIGGWHFDIDRTKTDGFPADQLKAFANTGFFDAIKTMKLNITDVGISISIVSNGDAKIRSPKIIARTNRQIVIISDSDKDEYSLVTLTGDSSIVLEYGQWFRLYFMKNE